MRHGLTHTLTHTNLHTHRHTHKLTHSRKLTHTHVNSHKLTHSHTQTYTYAHSHIYNIHTHTHTEVCYWNVRKGSFFSGEFPTLYLSWGRGRGETRGPSPDSVQIDTHRDLSRGRSWVRSLLPCLCSQTGGTLGTSSPQFWGTRTQSGTRFGVRTVPP